MREENRDYQSSYMQMTWFCVTKGNCMNHLRAWGVRRKNEITVREEAEDIPWKKFNLS